MGAKTRKPPKIFERGYAYGRTPLWTTLDVRIVRAAEVDDVVASLVTANRQHDEHDCDHRNQNAEQQLGRSTRRPTRSGVVQPASRLEALPVSDQVDLQRCAHLLPLALPRAGGKVVTDRVVVEVAIEQSRRPSITKSPHNGIHRCSIDSWNSVGIGGAVLHCPVVASGSVGCGQVQKVLRVVKNASGLSGIAVQSDTGIVAADTWQRAEPRRHSRSEKHRYDRNVCRKKTSSHGMCYMRQVCRWGRKASKS